METDILSFLQDYEDQGRLLFLEHIVINLGSKNEAFHAMLWKLYLKKIIAFDGSSFGLCTSFGKPDFNNAH
jgi:hypothetical protein